MTNFSWAKLLKDKIEEAKKQGPITQVEFEAQINRMCTEVVTNNRVK